MEWYQGVRACFAAGSRMNNCFLLSAHNAWFARGRTLHKPCTVTVDNRVVEGLAMIGTAAACMHGPLTGTMPVVRSRPELVCLPRCCAVCLSTLPGWRTSASNFVSQSVGLARLAVPSHPGPSEAGAYFHDVSERASKQLLCAVLRRCAAALLVRQILSLPTIRSRKTRFDDFCCCLAVFVLRAEGSERPML